MIKLRGLITAIKDVSEGIKDFVVSIYENTVFFLIVGAMFLFDISYKIIDFMSSIIRRIYGRD